MRSTSFGLKRPTHPGVVTLLAGSVLVLSLLAATLIGILAAQAQATTIVEWVFDSVPSDSSITTGTLSPVSGSGVVTATNVTGTSFQSGSGGGSNNSAFETTGYPAQSTSDKTAGIEIRASTVGFQDILLTFHSRHSTHSANKVVVRYSTDGTNFNDFQTITITGTVGQPTKNNTFFQTTVDFSAIAGLDNNPNAKFKIVATYGNGSQYLSADNWTASSYTAFYTSANIRFDNIKVSGTPFTTGTATSTATPTTPPTNTPTETAVPTKTSTPVAVATSSPGGACMNYTVSGSQVISDAVFDGGVGGTGLIIPFVLTSTVNVPDDLVLSDVDVVGFQVTHEYMQDLKAELINPQGTVVTLFTQVGSNGTAFDNTIFDENVLSPIEQGSAPFTGSYDPEGNLAVFNTLHSVGTWKLRISDVQEIHTGSLNAWTLKLCTLATPTPTNTPTITPTPTSTPGNAETATAQAVEATAVAGTATAVWLSTPGNPATATLVAATATSAAETATSVAATATSIAEETSIAATATSFATETSVAATSTSVAATEVAATATSVWLSTPENAASATSVAATATSVWLSTPENAASATSAAATATAVALSTPANAATATSVSATSTAVALSTPGNAATATSVSATSTAVALSTPGNAATATSVSATSTAVALSTPGNAATATSVSATSTAVALSTPGNAATATSVAATSTAVALSTPGNAATATSIAATATAVAMTPTPSGPVIYRVFMPIIRR